MATRNRFAGTCDDCGVSVPAEAGLLYRYSGANRQRRKIKRGQTYAYVVRCLACAEKRGDGEKVVAVESSGQGSPGYSEACGVWD